VTWVGEVPVLAGGADDDPGGGAVVWWGTGDGDRLAGGPLGGPGDQHASGVATDGRTLVVVGAAPEGGAVGAADLPSGP
jgi:hypothetical protein